MNVKIKSKIKQLVPSIFLIKLNNFRYLILFANLKLFSFFVKKKKIIDEGLNLFGPLYDLTGIGEACRGDVRALNSANIPFCIIDQSLMHNHVYVDSNIDAFLSDKIRYQVNLFHMNPDSLYETIKKYKRKSLIENYNIGFWAWELERMPRFWKYALMFFDEIWVPSHFTGNAIKSETNKDVLVFPHSIYSKRLNDNKLTGISGLEFDGFSFLTIFDTDSLAVRKNPEASILSFLKAFKGNEDVQLIVKVKKGKNKEVPDILLSNNDSRIKIIYDVLSTDQMLELYNSIDCLISLHRTEGFGLTLAEAMSLGKPVIATNWSGNLEFMNQDNSCLVKNTFVNVGNDFISGLENCRWAEPDVDDAAFYMQRLYNDKEFYNNMALKAKEFIKDHLDPNIIGQKMKERISIIHKK